MKEDPSWFIWLLKGVFIVGFLIMLGRLLDLQVIRGAYYTSLADNNRVRRVPILAPRGSILARDGEILSESQNKKEAESYKENTETIIIPWERKYKESSDFGHILGYLGLVKEGEVGKVRGECPEKGVRRPGSFVGRTGLEEQYDCKLSGIDGEELIEVDAMGKKIRSLGQKPPIKGEDITTTIQFGLQKKVAAVMQGKKGAVVALSPKGEVLSLYSSPSFDPSDITPLLQDKNLPLFNRAISGIFHPGSIYKPLVALAALEESAIDEGYTFDDTGRIIINTNYGNFVYNNWYFTQYGGKEGQIDVKRALARSTDTFFYQIGDLLGIEKLDLWSHTFRLDEKTGIDLPGEIAGLVPSPEWKLKVLGERWFLGNTYHMAIGQGDLAVTPLGITSGISIIASNGKWCKPHVVNGEQWDVNSECIDLGIQQKNINIVKEGMMKACQTGGTAFPFFDFQIPVACKTGTAQTDDAKDSLPHAWFTIFAPSENPEIVLTVLVEKGGEGSKVAAPIAREILDYWFYERKGLEIPKKQGPSVSATPGVGE